MDNLPENAETKRYLDLLSAQLHSLPPEVQAEQREEVRLHLSAMAMACRELGSGADAAECEALARFGDPVQVGQEITRRYWPADVLPGTFWSACGTAFFWTMMLHGAVFGIVFLLNNWLISTGADLALFHWNTVFACTMLLGAPVAAGAITAWIAPRYAVPATLLAPWVVFGSALFYRAGSLGFPAAESIIDMMLGSLTALIVSRRLGRKRFSWPRRLTLKKRVKQ
jgi:hypothetical protein